MIGFSEIETQQRQRFKGISTDLIALTCRIAKLSLSRTLDDVLKQAAAVLGMIGAESTIVLLNTDLSSKTKAISGQAGLVHGEYGQGNSAFRYKVGAYYRQLSASELQPTLLDQGPSFGWRSSNLEDSRVMHCAPLFVGEKVAGTLAFVLFQVQTLDSSDFAILSALATAVGSAASGILQAEHAQRSVTELQVLYEMSAIMAGLTLDLGALLRQTAQIASRVVHASAATLLLLDEKTNELVLELPSQQNSSVGQEFRLRVEPGITGTVMDEGRAVFVNQVDENSPWRELAAKRYGLIIRSLLCVPMQVYGRTVGALLVMNKIDNQGQAVHFNDEDAAMLNSIGTQSAAALENARLYQNLLTERDRLIAIQEEGRRSFSRDLHDGPAQGLAMMVMRIDLVRRMLSPNPQTVLHELAELERLVRNTSKEVRNLLLQLRPIVLETQGLLAAIQTLITERQGEGGVTYSLSIVPGLDLSSLTPASKGAIYSIMQEAINNARKSAMAKHVWLELSEQLVQFNIDSNGNLKNAQVLDKTSSCSLVVVIRDDGRGFDVDKVLGSYTEKGSYGLLNMRERAELLNGDLQVQSEVGKGTTITLRVPLPRLAR